MSDWQNSVQLAYDYAEDVRSGKRIEGLYVRLAVERYFDDHKKAKKKGIYWDEKAAQRALGFFECLCFTQGSCAGKPFIVEPWEAFIVANIFGWKKSHNHKRRFTEVYVEVAKKNGKTELCAGIALYMLILDGEEGAEVYLAASARDQAAKCFKAAKQMASKSPIISGELSIQTYSLYHPDSNSFMRALSSDAGTSEGMNSSCTIYDEFHVQKNDDLRVSLRSGMAAREQPLFFHITTAGANQQGPCFVYRKGCIELLKGRSNRENLFTMIYSLDENDDWRDEKSWVKANPNLDVSTTMEFLRGEFKTALTNPRAEVEFKTKHLNMWVGSAKTWIRAEKWNALANPGFTPPRGSVWFGGIDLGATDDMSAFSQFFPEYSFLRTRFYISEKAAEYATTSSGIDYKQWAKEGYLTITPGDATDYGYILRDVEADIEQYDPAMTGFDVARSTYFRDALAALLGVIYCGEKKKDGTVEYGYRERLRPFPQAAKYFNSPTRSFEVMCENASFTHDGNPISAWQLGNVTIIEDSNNNLRPTKSKSTGKIDGIVAKLMALEEWEFWGPYINNNLEFSVA